MLEAGLRRSQRRFGMAAAPPLASDQHAGDDGQAERQQRSSGDGDTHLARAGRERRGAARQQPGLLVPHARDQFADAVREDLALAGHDRPSRGDCAFSAARVDGALEAFEAEGNEPLQGVQPSLLRRIVARQRAELREERAQGGPSGVVRHEVGGVARDDIATDPRLRVDHSGEGGLEVRTHLQRMSHPAGTLDRRGCATERRRADHEDDGEGQAEPHLDLPLQRECHAASSTSRTLRAMPSGVNGFCT